MLVITEQLKRRKLNTKLILYLIEFAIVERLSRRLSVRQRLCVIIIIIIANQYCNS